MGFASLGSGSRGNGTLVALKDRIFLVDCGFTLRQTETRLARAGLSGGDLDAILVSHEHSDHIGGVAALAHKFSVPVYASYGTLRSAGIGLDCHAFDGDVPFEIGGVGVNPVRVPHDAREPTQFVFSGGSETIGVLSDLGSVTQHVLEQYRPCTHLLVEANHDRGMLIRGSYPPGLKRRVAADYGHLSNEQALALLSELAHSGLHVVIGHVSEQNNRQDLLEAMFAPLADRLASLSIASQVEGCQWVGSRPLSRQMSFTEAL